MTNRYVFVVPCFNAEKTIERMLMSVFCQTYDNWLILIRDDMSTDGTIEKILDVCEHNNVYYDSIVDDEDSKEDWVPIDGAKVVVWENTDKFWEVKNVLSMIRSKYVEENDIICRLDGDDFLCNLCSLQDIEAAYQQSQADCLWTAHRWADNWMKNISGPIPGGYMIQSFGNIVKLEGEKDIYKWSKRNWSTSHLKTFRKNLITDVNDENFRGNDGEYIRRAGDRAIYYPVVHKSKTPVFLPIQTYYYTIDDRPETYASLDAKFQLEESDFLSDRGFIV